MSSLTDLSGQTSRTFSFPRLVTFDRPRQRSAVGGLPKRIMDISIAGLALVLLAPLLLTLALLVKLSTGGTALFAHDRIGFGRRKFACLKFRTMVMNSKEVLEAYLAANPAAAREWQETRKLRNDPRVTRLGYVLRKTSLDELPQLFNVLRGDMSCVGPRPVVSDELERYGQTAHDYCMARPGITGLWQVSGRSDVSYQRRVELDRFYVRRWTLVRDLVILIMTIPAVLKTQSTA